MDSRRPWAFPLTVALLLMGATVACDKFFVLRGAVVSCRTGQPLTNATVLARLDRGVEEEDKRIRVDSRGRFELTLNEAHTAWATVSVEAPGHAPWRTQFRGVEPRHEIEVCLGPTRTTDGAASELIEPGAGVPR